jgi:hypothetical protein
MDLLKLPDDIIKFVESYVDKRPVFANELLNRPKTEYYYGLDHFGLPDDLKHCSNVQDEQHVARYWSNEWGVSGFVWSNALTSLHHDLKSSYSFRENQYMYQNHNVFEESKYKTLGLLMRKKTDANLPPQTYNCGMSYCKPRK